MVGTARAVVRLSRRRFSMATEEAIEGWAMVLPIVVGLVVFNAGPMLASLYLSLTSWDLFGSPVYVAGANYRQLFSDELFVKSLVNTLYYALLTVPLGTALALALAAMLNRRMKGINLFRTIFFLPSVCSDVAIAVVWVWLYIPGYGLFDIALSYLGIPSPHWLSSTHWALPSVAMMAIWQGLGYNMVIFLAGLQGIAQDYYEAAMIDGASPWRSFRHITLPLLSPLTFFVIIMFIIGALQVFASVYIMTTGGPVNSTLTMAYYLFRNAFEWFRMGYASAQAYVLFLIIMIVTAVQFLGQRRWVYYEA
ncbi:MAG: carbohydrate ABC transporter permease [Anaerolineae bacterium]